MQGEQPGAAEKPRAHRGSLLLGLVLLSALIGVVVNFGEIERFLDLIRQARPAWLAVGLVLQFGTYVCEALAWQYTLRAFGLSPRLAMLVPLSVAKLFSDQAVPSGGLSGTAFFLAAMRRYGIESAQAMACLLINLVAYFASCLLMAAANLLILAWYHALNRWIVTVTLLFTLLAIGVPFALLKIRWRDSVFDRIALRYMPALKQSFEAFHNAPAILPRRAGLMTQQLLLHTMVMLLDATTLWLMLRALGQDASFLVAVSGFVTAAMVASLSPIPLGLGTFEATSVAMLNVLGVGLEAGLMATILLRGMTVWLPMLPGLWLIRREFRPHVPASPS